MTTLKLTPQPWYREPWPWLLMSGPAIVVVAGVITTVIAFRTADGLVADDYYKQGLTINQTLKREQRAAALGVRAGLLYLPEQARVQVMLEGVAPQALTLRLAHPTRAGRDQVVALQLLRPGLYEGALPPGLMGQRDAGRWLTALETPDWRVAGVWLDPASAPLRLEAAAR